ncbi:unnamed protein product, partial [Ectocarpus fasciculatus]
IPYLWLTVGFITAIFLFEHYLDRLVESNRQLHPTVVPEELKHAIPQDKFTKSLLYGVDKFSFGNIEGSFMFLEGFALILLGWLPYIWDFSLFLIERFGLVTAETSYFWKEVLATTAFMFLISLHDTVISLPFSLYSTFVVEEKHGFNKTTLGLFLRDKLISLVLGLVIGCPIFAVVIYVVRNGGPYFYFYVWAFLFSVTLVLMTIYPTLIAPLFNTYTPLKDGKLYDQIEELAKKVDFPLTKIFVVDGSKRSAHSNAYFYGFFKNKRIVLYDTLIAQVETPELLAILGHEIGHWKLWHTMQGFFITQIYIFTLFLSFSAVQNTPDLFSAFGFKYEADESGHNSMPVLIALTLFTQTFWGPVEKCLTLAMNFNSRYNEFQADKYACTLGMGHELAEGLVKISVENLGNMVPDSLYSLYHFSHPPLVERLRAIKA